MTFLNDLTIQQIVTRSLAYAVFAALHGGSLALILRIFESTAPSRQSRLTLNPMVHLAIWGAVMAILFRAGWVRPFSVSAAETGRGRLFMAAILSIALMLLVIPMVDFIRPLIALVPPGSARQFLQILANQVQEVTLGSTMLGLLPLPVLTGRLFLVAAIPELSARMIRWEGPTTFILVAAMVAAFDPSWFQWLMPLLSLTR